jgi:hypothetical protein
MHADRLRASNAAGALGPSFSARCVAELLYCFLLDFSYCVFPRSQDKPPEFVLPRAYVSGTQKKPRALLSRSDSDHGSSPKRFRFQNEHSSTPAEPAEIASRSAPVPFPMQQQVPMTRFSPSRIKCRPAAILSVLPLVLQDAAFARNLGADDRKPGRCINCIERKQLLWETGTIFAALKQDLSEFKDRSAVNSDCTIGRWLTLQDFELSRTFNKHQVTGVSPSSSTTAKCKPVSQVVWMHLSMYLSMRFQGWDQPTVVVGVTQRKYARNSS